MICFWISVIGNYSTSRIRSINKEEWFSFVTSCWRDKIQWEHSTGLFTNRFKGCSTKRRSICNWLGNDKSRRYVEILMQNLDVEITKLTDIKFRTFVWSICQNQGTVRPSVLLKTNLTSMPLSICNSTLFGNNHPSLRNGIRESQCCAYDPEGRNDACQGDSGGPLQIFSSPAIGTIVGVVSFGISCGTTLPGVYTRVAYYIDWIERIVWPNSSPGL